MGHSVADLAAYFTIYISIMELNRDIVRSGFLIDVLLQLETDSGEQKFFDPARIFGQNTCR